MSKGLIIGLAGLGIGLAVAGGVGGYFINDAFSKKNVQIPEEVPDKNIEHVVGDYNDYDFPEEFNYVSHTIYNIGEKFALFSSQTIGCYVLNKETKEFNFFNSSSVSTHSKEINGHVYFWLSNNNLFRFNVETGEHEIVSMNSGVAFSSLYFIGYQGNTLLMRGMSSGYSTTSYYFVAFDTEKGESTVVSLTNTQYNRAYLALDLGDCYWLTYTYSASSGSGDYDTYLVNKVNKEITTLTNCYVYDETKYYVKGKKVYALCRYNSSYSLCVIDISSGEVSKLEASQLTTSGKFYECEKGLVYSYVREVNSSSYSSYYAYYISFADDSITTIQNNGSNAYIYSYIINGKLLMTPSSSSNSGRNGTLATFNESTKTLDTIYTALITSSSSTFCTIYEFEGEYYVSADSSNFAKMTFKSDGGYEFKNINLKVVPSNKNVKLGENRYLFLDSGVKYYDFENDVYKNLITSSSSSSSGATTVTDYEIKGDVVVIYASNHIKYEFNMKSLSFRIVAYWEDIEID